MQINIYYRFNWLIVFLFLLLINPDHATGQCGAAAAFKPTVSSTAVCSGSSVYVYATGMPVSRWVYRDNGAGSWIAYTSSADNISMALSASVNTVRTFKAIFATADCASDTTDGVDVNIIAPFYGNNNTIALSSTSYQLCGGSSFTLRMMSPSHQVTQWISRDNGGNWTSQSITTAQAYTTQAPVSTSQIVRDYKIIVRDPSGCRLDTSDAVTLVINPVVSGVNVNVKPTATGQGAGICAGVTVNTQVEWPFEIGNWLYKDANASTWTQYASTSASTNDFTTNVSASTTRAYRVVLLNSNTCTADSSDIVYVPLKVPARRNLFHIVPRITGANQDVCAGSSQSFQLPGFSSTATWYYRDSLNGNWTSFATGSSTSLSSSSTISKDITREIRVVINNTSNGCTVDTTTTVSYKIKSAAKGYINLVPMVPTNVICQGASITATLTNVSSPSSWQYHNIGGNWISSGSGNSFTDNNTLNITADVMRGYRAIITNSAMCRIDTTQEVQVMIKYPTPGGRIGVVPTAETDFICSGGLATAYVPVANAQSVVKWIYRDNNAGNWNELNTQTSYILNDNSTTQVTSKTIRSYRAILRNYETFRMDTSDEVKFTINPAVYGNHNATPVTTVNAFCNQQSNALSIQQPGGYTVKYWLGRDQGSPNWSQFGFNSTSTSDFVNTSSATKTYRVLLFNASQCAYDTSNALVMPVTQRLGRYNNSISPVSNQPTICSGATVQLTTSNVSGVTVVRWMSRDNGSAWKNISSSSTSYSENGVSTRVLVPTTREYRVVLSDNNNCATDTSGVVPVLINPMVNGTYSAYTPFISTSVVCAGNSISTSISGFTGSVQKWVYRDNKGPWSEFAMGTSSSTSIADGNTFVASAVTREYRAYLVRTGTCIVDTSQISAIQIKPFVYGNANAVQPVANGINLCSGTSYNVSISGYTGSIQKWIYQKNGSRWLELTNASTSTAYTESNPTALTPTVYSYRVILRTTACTLDTSSAVSVLVNPRTYGNLGSALITSSSGGLLCSGSPASLSANVSTLPTSATIRRWMYMDNMNGQWIEIPSSTSFNYNHTATTVSSVTTRSYRALINNSLNCSYDSSAIYSLTIFPISYGNVGVKVASSQSIVCNASVVPNLTINGTYAGTIVKWMLNDNGNGWTDFGYATTSSSVNDNNTFVTTPVTRSYRVLISNLTTCTFDTSNAVNVSLLPQTRGNLNTLFPIGTRVNTCYSKPVQLSLLNIPSGYTVVKWIYNDNNGNWNNFVNSTASTTLQDNNTFVSAPVSRSYRVILSNNTSCSYDTTGAFTTLISPRSANIGLRNTLPTANPLNICAGQAINLSVVPGAGNELLRWVYSDNGSAGPWNDVYNTYNQTNYGHPMTNVTVNTTRLYRAILTDTSTCDLDSTQSVAVSIKAITYGRDTSLSISAQDSICVGSVAYLATSPGVGNSVQKWLYAINNGVWQNFSQSTQTNALSDYATLFAPGTRKTYTVLVLKGATCSMDTITKAKTVYLKSKTYGNGNTTVSNTLPDTVCAGSSVSLSTSGTVEGWIYSDDNMQSWTAIPNSATTYITQTSLVINNSGWRYYKAIINTGSCNADTSRADSVYLRNYTGGYLAVTPTTSKTIYCAGNTISLSLPSVSGATVQRWLYRDNGGDWNTLQITSSLNVTDANTYPASPITRDYRVIVLRTCSYDTSGVLSVTISPKVNASDTSRIPTVTTSKVCTGSAVTGIQVTAGTGNTIARWLYRDNGGVWNVLVIGNSNNISDYNTYTATPITREYVAIINNNNTCRFDTTATVSVTINPIVLGNNNNRKPNVVSTACMGSSYNISLTVASDTTIMRVLYSNNGGAWTDRGSMSPSASFSGNDFANAMPNSYSMGYRMLLYKASTCTIDTTAASTVNVIPRVNGSDNSIVPTAAAGVCSGVSFNITVTPGSGNTIQNWIYREGTGPWNGVYLSNATLPQIVNTASPVTRTYRALIVKGSNCTIDTSAPVNVIINPLVYGVDTAATTTVASFGGIVCSGSTAQINTSSLGGAPIITWLYRNDTVGPWNNMYLSGTSVTDNNTNVTSTQIRQYAVITYKAAFCRYDTSAKNGIATFKVPGAGNDNLIQIQSNITSSCAGTPIAMTNTVIGTGTVQAWLRSENYGPWTTFYTGTATTLTDYNTQVASQTIRSYRILVKRSSSCSVDSGAVYTDTINPRTNGTDTTIVPVASYVNVCANNAVNLAVVQGSGNNIIKWISSTDNGSWTDLAVTSANAVNDYNTSTTTGMVKRYRVIISKGNGCSIDTSAEVTVNILPTGYGNQPRVIPVATKSGICAGDIANLSVSGLNGSTVLKWLYRDNAASGWNEANVSSSTYVDLSTLVQSTTNREYRAMVINASGCSFDSTGKTTVTINPVVVGVSAVSAQASQSTVCNGSPVNVFINPPQGYMIQRWIYKGDTNDWSTLVSGSTASVLDLGTSVTANTQRQYRAIMYNGSTCRTDSSGTVSVNIKTIGYGNNLSIIPFSSTSTICSGTPAVITVSGFSGNGHQWHYRDTATDPWTVVFNSATTFFHTATFVNYTRVREYRAVVFNSSNCSYDTTGTMQLTIKPQLQGNANNVLPTTATPVLCSGTAISVSATGFINGGKVVGWIHRDDNGPWVSIPASASETINHPNTTVSAKVVRQYRALVATGCTTDTTAALNVTIDIYPAKPVITRIGSSDSLLCNTTSTVTYQWKFNGTAINGATASKHKAAANGSYTVEVSNSSGCKATSDAFAVSHIGLFEDWLNEETKIYPNPTFDGFFKVQIERLTVAYADMVVTDALGRVVYQTRETPSGGVFNLDLSGREAGVYFLRITVDGTSIVKRVTYSK